MQAHTRIYFDFFGYDESSWIMCEMPRCGKQAVDINHIDARGMGGDKHKTKDHILNLMAMCRNCHEKYADRSELKEWLKTIHFNACQRKLKSS